MVPPRLLEMLASCILDARDRHWILGDLREEYARVAEARGAGRARRWYVRQALRSIGPSLRRRMRTRGGRGRGGVRELLFAQRALMRRPLPTLLVVLALAFAIGANVATFAIMDGVLLAPLSYPEAERIVLPHELHAERFDLVGWASVPNALDWGAQARSFERLGLFRGRSMAITGGEEALYVYGAFASSGFFDVFGTPPLHGRTFVPGDATGEAVVMLSHGLWQRRYGGDPAIIGRGVIVDGTRRTVVGIMPPGFHAPAEWIGVHVPLDLWIPFPTAAEYGRGDRSYSAVARLAPGVSIAEARTELRSIQSRLQSSWPEANEGWQVHLASWKETVVGPVRGGMLALFVAMTLVLLVASANAGNLVLGRVLARVEDLRIRAALGASRARLVAGAAAEPLLLTLAGVVLGLAVAALLLGVVTGLNPGSVPRLEEVRLGARAVAFASVIGVLVTVIIGAAQSIFVLRLPASPPGSAVRTVGPGGAAARASRDILAVIQLALAAALLIASTLVARGFVAVSAVDPGFDAENVLALTVALSWNRIDTLDERAAFTTTLLDRLRALPGVTDVAMVNSLPLSGSNSSNSFMLPSRPGAPPSSAAVRGVSPGYARMLRIPVRGREFMEEDLAPEARTALVNEAFVRRFLPDRAPIGERIALQDGELLVEIVGVVGDVRHYGLDEAARPEMYLPYSRETLTSKTYLMRTSVEPATLAEEVRRALREVDPDQPVRDLEPLHAVVARSLALPRFNAVIMSLLAALAVLLAAVGLFAVLSALVAERVRELAVRIALGARRGSIIRWILGRTLRLALPAAFVGLLLARWAGTALQAHIAGIRMERLSTGGLALVAFFGIAIAAALGPAARAARTDPARVLREEV